MREIKFKYILEIKNSKFIKTFDMEEIEEGCIGEWISESHYDITSKDEHIEYCLQRLQYTGLEDKNGVEIYEGDVLKWSNINLVVEWRNDNAEFSAVHKEGDDVFDVFYNFRKDMAEKRCEVIGNIYESPELLEVSK